MVVHKTATDAITVEIQHRNPDAFCNQVETCEILDHTQAAQIALDILLSIMDSAELVDDVLDAVQVARLEGTPGWHKYAEQWAERKMP